MKIIWEYILILIFFEDLTGKPSTKSFIMNGEKESENKIIQGILPLSQAFQAVKWWVKWDYSMSFLI